MGPTLRPHPPGLVHVSRLAVAPGAAMITGCGCLFKCLFSLGLCLGMGLPGHWPLLCLVFSEPPVIFSLEGVLTYIPTNSVGGLPFPHTLWRLYCCRVFSVAALVNVRCCLAAHCICLSLRTSDAEHRPECSMASLRLLQRNVRLLFGQPVTGLFVFLTLSCASGLCALRRSSLCVSLQDFFPF